MSSDGDISEIKARLEKVERQARYTKGWLIVLGICVFLALFGSSALRVWQINAACNTIVAGNPSLEFSECMRRVHEAWQKDEDTIRLD
jgi:small neutral amino acid transporter SnatA (MarC family)